MKLISCDENEVRLKAANKWGNFVFDISLVPLDAKPKHLVIEEKRGKSLHEYKMSWRKFLRQIAIGDVVLLDKKDFALFVNGKKVGGRMT